MAEEYTGKFPDHPLRGIISDMEIQKSIILADRYKDDAIDLTPNDPND